jgi:hypothetical protein
MRRMARKISLPDFDEHSLLVVLLNFERPPKAMTQRNLTRGMEPIVRGCGRRDIKMSEKPSRQELRSSRKRLALDKAYILAKVTSSVDRPTIYPYLPQHHRPLL